MVLVQRTIAPDPKRPVLGTFGAPKAFQAVACRGIQAVPHPACAVLAVLDRFERRGELVS